MQRLNSIAGISGILSLLQDNQGGGGGGDGFGRIARNIAMNLAFLGLYFALDSGGGGFFGGGGGGGGELQISHALPNMSIFTLGSCPHRELLALLAGGFPPQCGSI